MVHLEPDTVAAKDPDDAALTILHECMHLADGSIGDDGGYYPPSVAKSAGWETMTDDEKVTNAAHYEEIPKRKLGKSVFKPDQTFKPGVSASTGGAVSFETQVRLKARDYVRRAWDAAVDAHNGIRKVRVDTENGNAAALFATYEARILEVSAITKMTIHLQKPKPHTIATLDVTQCEGVAHGLSRMTRLVGKQPVPAAPVAPKTKQDYIDEAVAGAAKDYGALTGNATDDKNADRLDGRPLRERRPAVTESVVVRLRGCPRGRRERRARERADRRPRAAAPTRAPARAAARAHEPAPAPRALLRRSRVRCASCRTSRWSSSRTPRWTTSRRSPG